MQYLHGSLNKSCDGYLDKLKLRGWRWSVSVIDNSLEGSSKEWIYNEEGM